MVTTPLTVCLAVFLAPAIAFSQATSGAGFAAPDDFDRFVTHYYQHPEPDRVVPSLHYLARDLGVPSDESSARAGLFAFYAAILKQDSSPNLASVPGLADLQDESPEFLWQVLWFAGTPASRALLESVAPPRTSARWERWDQQRQVPSRDPLALPPQDTGALEIFWGSFFATGDPRYVERVISVLALAGVEHDAGKIRIGASAEASLLTNARQHPKVLEICKAQLPKQPRAVRKMLAAIVARATAP
jgi:hypothetical protein